MGEYLSSLGEQALALLLLALGSFLWILGAKMVWMSVKVKPW